jgi:hypothetical protein
LKDSGDPATAKDSLEVTAAEVSRSIEVEPVVVILQVIAIIFLMLSKCG